MSSGLVSPRHSKMTFLCNISINCSPDWYNVEKYYCGDQCQDNTLENNASSPLLESEILHVVHEWSLLCHYWVTDVAALLGISEKISVDRTPIFSLPLSCSIFITSFVPTAPSPCLLRGIFLDNWIFKKKKKMDMGGCVGWRLKPSALKGGNKRREDYCLASPGNSWCIQLACRSQSGVCGGDSSSRQKVGGEAEETILHLLVGLKCLHVLPLFVNQSTEN